RWRHRVRNNRGWEMSKPSSSEKAGSAVLKSGDPGDGFQGKIGRTLQDSKPWWRPPTKPPAGAPNIIVILLDDLGFSDFGCYGGEIATPNIDRLAHRGLRFTNYTTVPMCTPARAAMMTGKNPHSVGCGWLTHADPGYPGYQAGEITPDAPTIPELLRTIGYSTYAIGKWHNTPDHKVDAAADRASWPLQRGFDRFYGFLGAETNYYSPSQIWEGNELLPIDAYPADYFCTDDWTEKAIAWMRAHRSACPSKPFYMHFATNAPHVPLHAKPEDIARYKGRYDAGWEALRQERFARQREAGVVGPDWKLPHISPGVTPWADVPADARPVMAAYMELYAALVDNTDQNVGRIVAELETLGILDNTLIIVTSDNGASSIGGPDGAANIAEKRITQLEDADTPKRMLSERTLGGVDSYPAYPVGWGNACNTPFRFYKRTPMNGGIRVPLIVQWPERLKDAGAFRRQWVHVTDILPTLLDLLCMDYPQQFKGYRTRGLDGVSFKQALTEGDAPTKRSDQYYELEGNRGYISGKWKIASLQPPGQKIDLDNWLLFDLDADPTECDNLAKTHAGVLAAMIEKFETDAEANYAYPLDNRTLLRALTVNPHEREDIFTAHTFYPDTETTHASVVSRLIADRNFEIECAFAYKTGDEGVIFSIGDASSGFVAYVMDRSIVFAYRGGYKLMRYVRLAIEDGEQRLRISHHAAGKRKGAAIVALDTAGRESVATAEIDMSPTILGLRGEGVDVGVDRLRKVVPDYANRGLFRYPNRIDWMRLVPGAQAPGSLANRAEEVAQLD
ncbi:MAG: arylsulfatase, partial [Hyphomicrobiales bacterium]|nr:arylsulfatase [Hyphomicrobiales bacterium]